MVCPLSLDEEPGDESRQLDPLVSVVMAMHSRQLLAIEVSVDRHQVNRIELAIAGAVDHVEAKVKELEPKTQKANAKLNYGVVDQLLERNRRNPKLIGSGV